MSCTVVPVSATTTDGGSMYLDIRELAQSWREEIDSGEASAETSRYVDLCEELGIDASPDTLEAYGDDFEPTLIAETDFEDYARELAEDIGAIDPRASWPL